MRRRLLILAALAAVGCTPSWSHTEIAHVGQARASWTPRRPLAEKPLAAAGSVASGANVGIHEDPLADPGGDVDAAHEEELGHVHEEDGEADDGAELEEAAPLPTLTAEEIAQRVVGDLPSLGSLSLGKPNAGALINGVQMPAGERWEIVSPQRAWATQETIDYLVTAIDRVHEQFPGAHKLSIGHLSRERGGRLYPHRSHQAGRDIDIGYYYVPAKAEWYRPATAQTLDLERSWALVKSFVVDTDVEMIFIDRSVQRLLKDYALSIGEDPSWLNVVFQYKSRNPEPIVRHTYGHKTHIHVRFYNPKAQQVGVRAYDALVTKKLITPRSYLVPYQARGTDTLAGLAKKAGTSPGAIQSVNGISAITPGQMLYVPMRGQVASVKEVVIPARRLPPTGSGKKRVVAAASE